VSYGSLGQQKSGHLHAVSKNTKTRSSGASPQQSQRGYGGAASKRKAVPGGPSGEGQTKRGYPRNEKAVQRPTRNTSAGRIKKGR
jgi:hypothetical protein